MTAPVSPKFAGVEIVIPSSQERRRRIGWLDGIEITENGEPPYLVASDQAYVSKTSGEEVGKDSLVISWMQEGQEGKAEWVIVSETGGLAIASQLRFAANHKIVPMQILKPLVNILQNNHIVDVLARRHPQLRVFVDALAGKSMTRARQRWEVHTLTDNQVLLHQASQDDQVSDPDRPIRDLEAALAKEELTGRKSRYQLRKGGSDRRII